MILSFLIPLIFGIGATFYMKRKLPSLLEKQLYNAGVTTLAFGSIVEGVLQIYGTTNSKVYIYMIFGILLLVISISLYVFRKNKI